MKKSVMKKWVKALRSGKYKQGRGRLNTANNFCCLGVLCDISKVGEWKAIPRKEEEYVKGAKYYSTNELRYGQLPGDVMKLAGMQSGTGGINFPKGELRLTTLNDIRKRSFKQIAAFIERNYRRL